MAEKSYIWTCTDIGDGGVNSFSLEVIMTWLGTVMGTFSPETSGVIPWKSTNTEIFELLGLGPVAPIGLLTPTYNSNVLTVDTGIGMTGGVFYVNTTPKTFNILALKSGLASATDRIVLRREVLAQTARLVYIPATAPSTVAPLVQNKVFWDVPIARIVLNGAGNYASFVDERSYASSPFANKVLLYRENVYETNPGVFQPQIGHDIAVPSGYTSLELIVSISGNRNVRLQFNNNTGNVYYPEGNPSTPVAGISLTTTGHNTLPASHKIHVPYYCRNSFPPDRLIDYPIGTYVIVDGVYMVTGIPAVVSQADRLFTYYPNSVDPIESIQIFTTGAASTMNVTQFSVLMYGIK